MAGINFNSGYTNDYLNKYSGYPNKSLTNNIQGLDAFSNRFGDYNSIKNGSYKKLLSAYQNNQTKANKNTEASSENNTSRAYKLLQNTSAALKVSTRELEKASLYEPQIKKEADPVSGKIKVSEESNIDGIAKAVKSFADSYNKSVDSFDAVKNNNIAKKGMYMTKYTAANASALGRIGIEVGKDNKLTVNEEKLKSANVSEIKSLFTGANSFGYNIGQRATQTENMSKNAVNKISRLYDATGNYKQAFNTDSIINDFF